MNTSNTHAQTEQNQTSHIINFSHRLHDPDADMKNIHHFFDTVHEITARTKGILEVVSAHANNSQLEKATPLYGDTVFYSLQSAIKEIQDLDAVVNAYYQSSIGGV